MRILIPTDFSEYAQYAIETGIKMAIKFNAHLDIVHFLDDSDRLFKESYPGGYDPILDLVQKNFVKLSRSLNIQGIAHSTIISDENLLEGISGLMQKTPGYDLLIMGSHGRTGYNQWYIGSNTRKVIRQVHSKVLIVKSRPEALIFKDVLFVTGLNIEDKVAFAHFLNFIRPFDPAKIHVLTIDTPSYFSQPPIVVKAVLEDFKKMTKDLHCETHFYPDYSVEAGVRHFSEDHNIDLISISNHVRHPLKRLFRGSNVEAIGNNNMLPVLTIDFDNNDQIINYKHETESSFTS